MTFILLSEPHLPFSARALPALGMLLLACTPLGAWVYEDPSFRLSRVEPRASDQSTSQVDSLDLIFLACNRNDYDLELRRLSAQLAMAGTAEVPAGQAPGYILPTRTMIEIAVTVLVADSALAPDRQHGGFELHGQTTVATPHGDRVLSWMQRGAVWRTGDSLHLAGQAGPECRPGLSKLPTYLDPAPRFKPPPAELPRQRPRTDSND